MLCMSEEWQVLLSACCAGGTAAIGSTSQETEEK